MLCRCPECDQYVAAPAGVASTERVRCPLCHAQFAMAAAAPADVPELIVVPPDEDDEGPDLVVERPDDVESGSVAIDGAAGWALACEDDAFEILIEPAEGESSQQQPAPDAIAPEETAQDDAVAEAVAPETLALDEVIAEAGAPDEIAMYDVGPAGPLVNGVAAEGVARDEPSAEPDEEDLFAIAPPRGKGESARRGDGTVAFAPVDRSGVDDSAAAVAARLRRNARRTNLGAEIVKIVLGGVVGLALGYYGLNYFGGERFDRLPLYLPGCPHTYHHWPTQPAEPATDQPGR
ncbi:MAG: hypothetical protein JW809_14035 [Pirellulales bacterium]|nr:hypothetical protein [Pirellulales bacterium]